MLSANDRSMYVVSALGGIGTGKSSLLNAIAGEYLFETGDGLELKTTQVQGIHRDWKYASAPKLCHLIDTPGLIDSNIDDRQTITEMTKYFKSLVHGVSAFLLVFNINDLRLDAYTQNMLLLFHQLLGKDFWNFVIFVFTHVDEDSLDSLEDNMEAVVNDQDGFISEIRRLHKLPRTFNPSVVFTTTQKFKSSYYTQRHMCELYTAVKACEERNNGKRFTCNWLRQILSIPNEEQKTGFIKDSIKDAWSSVSHVCQMQ
ncbi:P-loop containing nucleoside triphosphate hydrolase protein [Pilobolus umbonatus]|nr:P-loop containing nucleoside triphosphate hydrolase protein [Pilobolus umbonatus]